ncbi:MAG TPA: tRNA uridine-5-carboxymethylaminomethyl(34) synthesis enzyme MnmG, partial [Fibrobacteria bacterium]|nr:tRNA uridine-5-carboxymethylaminomethyl(34) synthesis enzyme MnmG [Fibrobacteria bacterium]
MKTDILVIGGGHAGIEAAAAAKRLGCDTVLATQTLAAIGRMSCNPAIGGVAKGQLVREIDALGGLMGRAADVNGIHFRMLNQSRGAAVWGPRAQQDMDAYSVWMRSALELAGVELLEAEVRSIGREGDGFRVGFQDGRNLYASKVVVTTGTFARGKLFRGEEIWDGGRVGEAPAAAISQALESLGLSLRRLKTGTPARLRRDSIHWDLTEEQPGDEQPWPFSSLTAAVANRVSCHIVRTNADTHARLREGFARSPLFSGAITGTGPRYCPSIEDKVSRFSERDSHQLFLEPEGLGNDRVYVNGFSSSLPADVQDAALRTIPALADCEVIRYGYAVEYDAIRGTELHPTLEVRSVPGLYLAGQTCGTSGYEEAAAQGLIAGANAAFALSGKAPLLLDRATSYMGVLVDDLTSLDLTEPYRLFTSRAEYRMHLRHDNAEDRLTSMGRNLGLVDDARWETFCSRLDYKNRLRKRLTETRVAPNEIRGFLESRGESVPEQPVRLVEIAKRSRVELADLVREMGSLESGSFDRLGVLSLESEIRYEGFFKFEERQIERVKRMSGH